MKRAEDMNLMLELTKAQQANYKLQQIIDNLKPVDLIDQFAMAALTGILSNKDNEIYKFEIIAEQAYKIASEMMEERENARYNNVYK